jgi:hypothetical protein
VRFAMAAEFLTRYQVQKVGNAIALEYWIPAAELDELNNHIIGTIEVISQFPV